MNKGDLIEAVAARTNESKAQATRMVDAVLECIGEGVARDDKVSIAGFGAFEKKHRAARKGVNPATKQPIQIPASTTVGFKPSSNLKESVNGAN